MDEGEILKRLVKKSGYSVAEVAEKLSVSRQTLSNYFSKAKLSLDIKSKVSTVLGIDISVFESKESLENSTTEQDITLSPVSDREYQIMLELLETQRKLIKQYEKKN